MMQQVVLVDVEDRTLGQEEKLAVHRSGALHRAFSVFLFDSDGRWLLQRRHPAKYHSGGLWTNTCCSHPAPGDDIHDAARRRLKAEMGIETTLSPLFHFTYRAELDNGLIEHELDHVFMGEYAGSPEPCAEEVDDWCWIAQEDLVDDLALRPERYTYWFRLAVPQVMQARERCPRV